MSKRGISVITQIKKEKRKRSYSKFSGKPPGNQKIGMLGSGIGVSDKYHVLPVELPNKNKGSFLWVSVASRSRVAFLF